MPSNAMADLEIVNLLQIQLNAHLDDFRTALADWKRTQYGADRCSCAINRLEVARSALQNKITEIVRTCRVRNFKIQRALALLDSQCSLGFRPNASGSPKES